MQTLLRAIPDANRNSPQNSAQNLQNNNETESVQEPDRSSNLMQDNVSSIDGTFPMNVSIRPEYLSEAAHIDNFGSINVEIGAIKNTFSSVYNQLDNSFYDRFIYFEFRDQTFRNFLVFVA